MADIKNLLKIIELSIDEICKTTECDNCPVLKVCTAFDEFRSFPSD